MPGLTPAPAAPTLPARTTPGGTISMSLVPLRYVHSYRVRGRLFHYYRRGAVQRRLPGEPGSPEWTAAYHAACAAYAAETAAQSGRPAVPAHPPGSLGALIATYRASAAWTGLRPATRADYEKGLALLDPHAHRPVRTLERPHVIRLREAASWRIDTDKETGAQTRVLVPSRANKMLAVLSILLELAIDLGMRRDNPALGVAKVALRGEGYQPWQPEQVAQFMDRAPEDWRFAALLALCTGQRGQDQVRMRWDDYDGTAIRVRELKTRTKAATWIACHPALCAALDARKPTRKGLTLLTRADGSPWPLNAFQKAAGHAIRDAGLTGLVWHGLRATAASWLAEGGCSDAEIMAITGHTTGKMVQHYRRGADRKRLASAAVTKLRMRHERDA